MSKSVERMSDWNCDNLFTSLLALKKQILILVDLERCMIANGRVRASYDMIIVIAEIIRTTYVTVT